tara:strand:- start:1862 stop:2359 length:498 start_codon:yes stop_codon:yes gene_type:complete
MSKKNSDEKVRTQRAEDSIYSDEKVRTQRAEDSIYQGYQFTNLKEAQQFIDEIMKKNKEWCEKHLDQIKKVKLVVDASIKPTEPGKVAKIYAQQQGFDVTLTISDEKKLQELPLIYNLVRMALPDNGNLDGTDYRKLVLSSCRQFLAEDFFEELREAYINEGLEC